MTKINDFYRDYVTRADRVILLLIGITLLLGCIYIVINATITHYTGINYLPSAWVKAIPILFVLTIFAMYAQKKHSPRMGFVTRTYGLYFFVIVALAILTTGLQYTPFLLIDRYLVAIDRAMGFNSIAVLNWTYAHPAFKHYLSIAYNTVGYQLFMVPVLIALLLEKKYTHLYFLMLIFSYFISTTIYYFFPTAGPTWMFHSPYFLPDQYDTSLKFFEVHHDLKVTTYLGGMIAFPSCHVIWAVICAYTFIKRKYIFFPLALLNTIVIFSTVLLGWHYLIDVIAGLLIAVITIILAHYTYNRCQFAEH